MSKIKDYEFIREFNSEDEVTEFINSDIVTKGYYYGIPKKNIRIDGTKVIIAFKSWGRNMPSRLRTIDNLGFSRIEVCN
jgi:hypothetical protein